MLIPLFAMGTSGGAAAAVVVGSIVSLTLAPVLPPPPITSGFSNANRLGSRTQERADCDQEVLTAQDCTKHGLGRLGCDEKLQCTN